MSDEKVSAAFHPFSSLEEAREALKPRDEIAQAQVDAREKVAGVDLSKLPRISVEELSVGNEVFHEGVWCEIAVWSRMIGEGERGDIYLSLKRAGEDDHWRRRLIVGPQEQFYTRKVSDLHPKHRHQLG